MISPQVWQGGASAWFRNTVFPKPSVVKLVSGVIPPTIPVNVVVPAVLTITSSRSGIFFQRQRNWQAVNRPKELMAFRSRRLYLEPKNKNRIRFCIGKCRTEIN